MRTLFGATRSRADAVQEEARADDVDVAAGLAGGMDPGAAEPFGEALEGCDGDGGYGNDGDVEASAPEAAAVAVVAAVVAAECGGYWMPYGLVR